jgi:hypothetical protein
MVPDVRREKLPAKLTVTFPIDLTDRLRRYHVEQGLGGTVGEAVQELVRAALDYPEVESSLLLSARRAGYQGVRRDFQALAAAALTQFEREWSRQQRDGERDGVGDGPESRLD